MAKKSLKSGKSITVCIDALNVAKYNPRIDLQPKDPEYLEIKESIEEFGYTDFIVVNKDLTVIGGHQRLKVLKDLGYDEIEVSQVELSKTQEKQLNLALNNIKGRWDNAKLTELLLDLKSTDARLDLTGFSTSEVDKLISGAVFKPDRNIFKEIETEDTEMAVPENTESFEDYSDFEEQIEKMAPIEDVEITIVVPLEHEEKVRKYLSNGEGSSGPDMGRGVLKLAGLL